MTNLVVHRGKDGWLFLVGGSNDVLRYYHSATTFTERMAEAWTELLKARADRCAALGARYIHLVAPEKLTIYSEHYDGALPYLADSPANRLPRAASAKGADHLVLDVIPYFMQQKRSFQLYWKTDTHWNFHGCFSAYQLLCSRLAIQPNKAIAQGPPAQADMLLDLGAKLEPPVHETFWLVDFVRNARRVSSNAIVNYKERLHLQNEPGLHIGSNVVFVNDAPDVVRQRVVLFGDSFAEYRPHLLTGMLAETFQEVHFVWSGSIDWHYVARYRPDIVVTEIVERFMGHLPVDDADLDAYVTRRMAPLFGAGA